MHKIIYTLIFSSLISLNAGALEISFEGGNEKVLSVEPPRSTGLNNVYIAFDSSRLERIVIKGLTSRPSISVYSNLGGGYAEEIPFTYNNGTAYIEKPKGDLGYIINDAGYSTYFWLVDYLPHMMTLTSAQGASVQNCDNTLIDINGSAPAIYYYTIDGRPVELSREIGISYNNLNWSETSESYIQVKASKILDHLSSSIALTPPLYCNSICTISGDRFLTQWGKEIIIDTPIVYANGLDVHTTATQTNISDDPDYVSNIIRSENKGIGGSAPVDVEFKAYTTDAVIHNEWQFAADERFEYIEYRFNEQNLDYTFTDEGTYYIRFVGSNSDGSCETVGETFIVSVGASDLKIPNAFTPNDDGVNDVWKVAYRSLLSFHCTIFDRYGNELYRFDDPSQGWDGKYKGKYVNPGVYFYVIEATGADGKKYKKGGDINIIKSKKYTGTGDSPVIPSE